MVHERRNEAKHLQSGHNDTSKTEMTVSVQGNKSKHTIEVKNEKSFLLSVCFSGLSSMPGGLIGWCYIGSLIWESFGGNPCHGNWCLGRDTYIGMFLNLLRMCVHVLFPP